MQKAGKHQSWLLCRLPQVVCASLPLYYYSQPSISEFNSLRNPHERKINLQDGEKEFY